jgi:hypothetical protein
VEAKISASQQAQFEPFDAAIAELERAAGDFLTGPGRVRCQAAFDRDPAAFAFLVRKALTKTSARSMLGLFVKIVAEEHAHVSARLGRTRTTLEEALASEVCVVCDGPATTKLKGVFWCDRHLAEELAA